MNGPQQSAVQAMDESGTKRDRIPFARELRLSLNRRPFRKGCAQACREDRLARSSNKTTPRPASAARIAPSNKASSP